MKIKDLQVKNPILGNIKKLSRGLFFYLRVDSYENMRVEIRNDTVSSYIQVQFQNAKITLFFNFRENILCSHALKRSRVFLITRLENNNKSIF